MSAGDPLREVEELFPDPGRNDWADVLRRAEPVRASSLRISTTGRVALICAAALLVTVPSLAATGKLHRLFSHPPRQIDLSTVVRAASGQTVASIGLALEGTVLTNARGAHLLPHRLVPTGSSAEAVDRYEVRWRLSIPNGKAGRVVVTHGGKRVAVLCAPCRDGDSGTLILLRPDASLLVNARLVLVVETGKHTAGAVVARPTRR